MIMVLPDICFPFHLMKKNLKKVASSDVFKKLCMKVKM